MHKSWGDLVKDTQFKQAFDKINKPKKGSLSTANSSSRTVMEAQYGFTILDIPANVVVSGDVTAYTFLITRDNTPATVFENLIINLVSNQEPKAYIHRFESNVAYGNSPIDISKFQGTSTMTPILYNASQSNSLNDDVEFFCVEVSIWSCGNHSEYVPGCQGHGSTGYVCEVSVGAGNHNSGGGSGGDSSSESSSNDTSTSSGTYSSGTNGGSSGQPVVVTAPVGPPVNLNKEPCEILMPLDSVARVTQGLDFLKTKVTAKSEFGYAITKTRDYDNNIVIDKEFIAGGVNVRIPTGGTIIGGAHNHPITGGSIPSWGDLNWTMHCEEDNRAINDGTAFNIIVVPDPNPGAPAGASITYAITIDNLEALQAQMTADFALPDVLKIETPIKKFKFLNDKQSFEFKDFDTNSASLEKKFLEYFSNYGINFAKFDPVTNKWNKLKLQNKYNPSRPYAPNAVISEPCN